MLELFKKLKKSGKLTEALLVGRNLMNKNPSSVDIFIAYMDLLLDFSNSLPSLEERKTYATQANVTLAFFEENADISEEVIELLSKYRDKVSETLAKIESEEQKNNSGLYQKIQKNNNEYLKKLFNLKDKISTSNSQEDFDKLLKELGEIDAKIEHDYLTDEQNNYYDYVNKSCTSVISEKMRELERQKNIQYNQNAIESYRDALKSFKKDDNKYKNQTQLFALVSKSLFGFDASRLFNETLIYYNHVYSYIFGKLDDEGKYKLTEFSIECERKLR